MHPAYYAGFFDADGAVMVHRCRKSYNLTVRVSQSSREVLDSFRTNYDGKVQGPYNRAGESNSKPFYFWAIDAAKAEKFLVDVLPYVIVKRERVELALEFRKLFKGANILPRGSTAANYPERFNHIYRLREDVYNQMRVLNQRGVQHEHD